MHVDATQRPRQGAGEHHVRIMDLDRDEVREERQRHDRRHVEGGQHHHPQPLRLENRQRQPFVMRRQDHHVGVRQKRGQRIGAAAGIALVGAVFFAQVANTGGDWARAFQIGLATAAVLVLIALVVGLVDHFAHRREDAEVA